MTTPEPTPEEIQEQVDVRNSDRAAWAETALTAFAEQTGQQRDLTEYEPQCVIADLLCDLRHYCKAHDVDFEDCARIGHNHFRCEVDPDDIELGAAAHDAAKSGGGA